MKRDKRKKRIISHPITTFAIISTIVIILSGLLAFLEVNVEYDRITASGEIESAVQTVHSLLNVQGIRYIFSSAAKNFVNFAPLGMILIALLGVGVAEKSGLLRVIFQKTTNKIKPKTLTFIIVFLGIITNFVSEVGYVILVPLAGLVFLANKRHPLAGMAAAFAGITGGYAANFLVGPIDGSLAFYTTAAARIIDSNYVVDPASNIFIGIAAVVTLSFVGMYITEKIIVPKLGRYTQCEELEEPEINEKQKRGLKYSLIATGIMLLLFIYAILPGVSSLPGSGMLLDPTETNFINQVFGYNSFFQEGIVFIVSIIFLVAGLFYGIGAKTVKTDRDLAGFLTSSFEGVGNYIVIIFFASQLFAYFRETQIGDFLVAFIGKSLSNISFTGLPLILILIIVVALLNILITNPTVKWAILAPAIVPICMQLNLTPEFTQAIFRAGDSMTNMITPLLAYFAIFLALAHKYEQKREAITIKKALSIMYPYSIAFSIAWVVLILSFYIINIPIGLGAFPTL